MRSIFSPPPAVLAIAVVFLSASTGLSQNDELALEPYNVYVAQEDAFAHCGPGDDYYRTDPLRYGQSLEVYAETDDGWLGIRPPEGSFCWLPAETVELDQSQEHGTIIEDRTVAWIGTQLGRARSFRWQVQLAKGEPVAVIGRSEREGPDGPQLWYRIVPPSGEYRWVHRDWIVMSSEELVESVRQNSGLQKSGQQNSSNEDTRSDSSDPAPRKQPEPAPVSPSLATSNDTDSGQSILSQNQAIGSGLREDWQEDKSSTSPDSIAADDASRAKSAVDAFQQGGLLASLEFLTRPRIREIGSESEPEATPNRDEIAADSNWVSGSGRNPASSYPVANASYSSPTSTPVATTIAQASAQVANDSFTPTANSASMPPSVAMQGPAGIPSSPTSAAFHVVPAERVAQVEAETRYADLDRLNLILSRLMAAQASAAEMEPLERAARGLAAGASDAVVSGRARMLAETAERYRRIATQRDGVSVVQAQASQPISIAPPNPAAMPAFGSVPVGTAPVGTAPVGTAPFATVPGRGVDNGVIEQTGYLVQVYSARKNSPPFALTDHAGRTVAYATPSPGVNLRSHLNTHISVVGTRGYLTGLDTPHVLVTQAVRTPD